MGLLGMLKNNRNLVELGFTIPSSPNHLFWELFHAVKELRTLNKLSIHRSAIDLQSMEVLMMTCHEVKTLTTLELSTCDFEEDALKFLAQTLSSNNNVINTLILGVQNCPALIEINMGELKVETLVLDNAKFEMLTFSRMVDSGCLQ